MAVAAARRAVESSGSPGVDAVITGTGLGCFAESERFLDAVQQRGEELLNPSVFIQTTHHAASSQVAFALDCRGYHNNYCHRAFSFESALLDASLLLEEGAARRILVGGMDELVPTYADISAGGRAPRAASRAAGAGPRRGSGFFRALRGARRRRPGAVSRHGVYLRSRSARRSSRNSRASSPRTCPRAGSPTSCSSAACPSARAPWSGWRRLPAAPRRAQDSRSSAGNITPRRASASGSRRGCSTRVDSRRPCRSAGCCRNSCERAGADPPPGPRVCLDASRPCLSRG